MTKIQFFILIATHKYTFHLMRWNVHLFFVTALSFFFFMAEGWSLYTKPWLGDPYAFEWQSAFTYSRYHKVQNAAVQLKHPSNDKLYVLDLGFNASDTIDLQAEIEFADTPRQKLGWRSWAFQARYLWLNDIEADACSLISGFNIREVPRHSLHDVSCPYHSDFNFELTTAAGKEWSKEGRWIMRTFGLAGVGLANHGSPWLRSLGVWEMNHGDKHRLLLGIEGYFGFGIKKHVDVDHFNGWAKFHHQSIDLITGYAYHMSIWGTWGVDYAYRMFAKNFPEHVHFITIFWCLPFSLF